MLFEEHSHDAHESLSDHASQSARLPIDHNGGSSAAQIDDKPHQHHDHHEESALLEKKPDALVTLDAKKEYIDLISK